MNHFLALTILSVEITEAQLLISGLVSGITIVGVIVKWIVASPEREAKAYQEGIAAEQTRSKEDVDQLRQEAQENKQEIAKLRNALLRLAVASDLTVVQRHDIAEVLGFPISKLTVRFDSAGGNEENNVESEG